MEKVNKKELARSLYLQTDKKQKEICELVGITENTFRAWKKDEHWAAVKGANTASPEKIIKTLLLKIESLSEAEDIQTDKIAKIAAVIDRLKPGKLSVVNYISAFTSFTNYLNGIDPAFAKKVNEHQNNFINSLVI